MTGSGSGARVLPIGFFCLFIHLVLSDRLIRRVVFRAAGMGQRGFFQLLADALLEILTGLGVMQGPR